MIDAPFRRVLPGAVGPLLALYRKLGWTPNQVTVIGCALGLVAAVAVALEWYWAALALWWLGRLFDGTDGIYARETRQVTAFGGYLDIVADMLAYAAMILGFLVARPDLSFLWAAILVLYVLCITTALALGNLERELGLVDEGDERSLRLAAGLAEGGETGIAYTLFLVFPGALGWLATLWLGVLVVTVVSRSLLARRRLR